MTLRLQNLDNGPGHCNEGSSYTFRGRLTDRNGNGVAGDALDSAQAFVYDKATGDMIRERFDLLEAEAIDGDGNLEVRLRPIDAPIKTEGTAGSYETHVLGLGFEWEDDGPEALNDEVEIKVKRMAHVPEED